MEVPSQSSLQDTPFPAPGDDWWQGLIHCRRSGFIAGGEGRGHGGSERSPTRAHWHHHRHTCAHSGPCTTLHMRTEALGDEHRPGLHTSKTLGPFPDRPPRRVPYSYPLPHLVPGAGSPEPSLPAHSPSLPGSVPKSPAPCKGPEGRPRATCSLRTGNLPGSPPPPPPWLWPRTSWQQLLCTGGQLRTWGESGRGRPLRLGAGVAAPRSPGPRGRALRPCSSAAGSAASAAPPTAAAAPRAPPSRRLAPAP